MLTQAAGAGGRWSQTPARLSQLRHVPQARRPRAGRLASVSARPLTRKPGMEVEPSSAGSLYCQRLVGGACQEGVAAGIEGRRETERCPRAWHRSLRGQHLGQRHREPMAAPADLTLLCLCCVFARPRSRRRGRGRERRESGSGDAAGGVADGAGLVLCRLVFKLSMFSPFENKSIKSTPLSLQFSVMFAKCFLD